MWCTNNPGIACWSTKGSSERRNEVEAHGRATVRTLGDTNVQILNDCVGDEVKNMTDFMMPKDVVLLENLRFYAGEEKNDEDFAENLAKSTGAEVYVNDVVQPIAPCIHCWYHEIC